MQTKKCNKCGEIKAINEFYKQKGGKFGVRCRCRECLKSHKTDKKEKIDYMKVYVAHNWVCGVCGETIDKNLKHPDPMSKSIDHINPKSKGGIHTYDNLQPAHLGCNSSKGNKIPWSFSEREISILESVAAVIKEIGIKNAYIKFCT